MCALVTGVQTCALPISGMVSGWRGRVSGPLMPQHRRRQRFQPVTADQLQLPPVDLQQAVVLEALEHATDRFRRQDRKSVVSGKSVSVRVYLGGRRIFKTKKTNDEKQSSSA